MQQSGLPLESNDSISSAPPKSRVKVDFARDEMNLAEFPLAVLSTRVNPKVKTLEFRDSQRLRDGEVIEREWIITGADKFGLPTSTDDDVLLGLMRLSMDQGFRSNKVYFTRYELLKILRWTTEGRSYSRLTKSLDRLSGVRIRATNAFYDNKSKAYQTCNFGIIDAYEINDSRGGTRNTCGSEQPLSFFIWSEMLFESFKAGFIKKLDLDVYFDLRSAVSRRLYRYLDKHFYYKPSVELPLTVLAFEKLGLSRSYKYDSSIKQQLEPAIEELTSQGFLSGVEYSRRLGQTSVCFKSAVGAQRPAAAATASPAQAAGTENENRRARLADALQRRGLTAKQAERLLRDKTQTDLEKIDRIIAYFDSLQATNDKRISRNPVGFLYRAVETPFRFKIPRSFHPAAATARPAGAAERSPGNRQSAADRQSGAGRRSNELRALYRKYRQKKARERREALSRVELTELYSALESRMRPMKANLSAERFEEALDGCVEDELARQAGAESFEGWQRQSQRRVQ